MGKDGMERRGGEREMEENLKLEGEDETKDVG